MRLWRPNAFLESLLAELEPGRAIDLACGAGREAVFLAAHGWRVVGVDVLPDALDRAADLARRHDVADRIEWRCVDLEHGQPELGDGFDLAVCFRFLHRPLFRRIASMLRPGGHWVTETFTAAHRQKHGKPRRETLVWRPDELRELARDMWVRSYSEEWRGDAHTARLWAQAPACEM